MKTKFTSILKIVDLEVKKYESELLKCRLQQRSIEVELESLSQEICSLPAPTYGSIALMTSSKFKVDSLRKAKSILLNSLTNLKDSIDILEQKYQKAMLKYEKVKHLHDIEVEKLQKELYLKESKDMDEVANRLFYRGIT
jgi:flagellar biosynthesis chaperone FliJ